ncbi:hypothetical protein B0T22DRAFT_372527 [Podospora appendiculata]|uniref:Ubiquitin carboxyl-terminal hydrolase n=1 Tax=Podospora appendiculata TaxID=314037 RepID=A0AAE0XKK6_9PEZI|nr:hypothetical protein B0T22DRAFT_372527 [Podospora appendiculata]
MPDKSLTVATYAAGASLAAITLIYVFGPTFFLDNDPSASSGGVFSSRKQSVVGLSNPANDCFINSVLQALAGLGDLRLYLIRETHRRSLDDAWVYAQAVPLEPSQGGSGAETSCKNMPDWKVEGLQKGLVTRGLKDILDSLNERPIYRKTISAGPFVKTLEQAFGQRISRQQQDAQEFLQIVAERLCDEYHAGRRARAFAKRASRPPPLESRHARAGNGGGIEEKSEADLPLVAAPVASPGSAGTLGGGYGDEDNNNNDEDETEEGFPLEGKFESQIECLSCGFKPRPTESTFCSLILNVPQVSSTTLNACFDGMFKTEYIDDFKCEKCRLLHALTVLGAEAQKSTSESFQTMARANLTRLRFAVDNDPEKPPADITLPDLRYAPKRRIARHIRLTQFPKIIAIHLSRSIYDTSNLSQKNSAKVAFPEQLQLGGVLQRRRYKLLGLVAHKGSHHSGHYETFRRQNTYPPFSNPHTFQPSGAYSKTASPASTPRVRAEEHRPGEDSPLALTPDISPSPGTATTGSSTPSLGSGGARDAETSSLRSAAASARTTLSKIASRPSSRAESAGASRESGHLQAAKLTPPASKPKKRKVHDRWWRISDEKVKEASTRDVLGMQREVYLLFYELERGA